MINVDFNEIIRDLLPSILRQPKHYDWLRCLNTGVTNNYEFISTTYYDSVFYEILHNSQVMVLEDYLNNGLQPSGGTIYITDVGGEGEVTWLHPQEKFLDFQAKSFLWFDTESPTSDLVYLYEDFEDLGDKLDFYVNISLIDYNDVEFRNIVEKKVNQYVLAGFTWEFKTY